MRNPAADHPLFQTYHWFVKQWEASSTPFLIAELMTADTEKQDRLRPILDGMLYAYQIDKDIGCNPMSPRSFRAWLPDYQHLERVLGGM